MESTTQMSKITIRPKYPQDDEWMLGMRSRVNDHLPPLGLEAYRHWEHVEESIENGHTERTIGERDGVRVAFLVLEKMWWVEKPGAFHGSMTVDPDLWGQGIGGEAFDWLVERARELEANRLYGNVRADRPISQAFVDHRGFTKTGHADRWSRLEVRKANLDGYVGVEDRLVKEGIHLLTLAETGQDEDFMRKLHKVSDEAVRDIPMSERFTESPFEMFLEELRDPELTPERVWIALAGDHDPVGLAVLPLRGEHGAFNGFTGVVPAYRGRGVARALKYRSIEWCHENEIDFIYTANDVNNERMLSINNSLGYEVLPISEEVVKQI